MLQSKIKSLLKPQKLLPAAMLFLACFTALDAAAATDKDAREKRFVHLMQLQLEAAQQEKAALADQVEALKKQLADQVSKQAALEKKLSGKSRQIAELSDKQQQSELACKQQLADLSGKNQDTEKQLQQMQQQYSETSKNLDQTKTDMNRQKKKADGDIHVCEKKNTELYQISVELMDKYKSKGVMDAIRQAEPFTQLEKVRIENLMQEYRDKADAGRISPQISGAQDVQSP